MIDTFFGSPGCGKTTFAVMNMLHDRKHDRCYANFEHSVPNEFTCDLDKLGEWSFPPGSIVHIDEAGIEYNNRKFKTLPQSTIKWFKLHRHFKCDVHVYSQSWEDMDITIRRLSDRLWYMLRVGPWTLVRRVYKRVTVDDKTQQIIDGYRMANLAWLLIYPLQCDLLFKRKFYIVFRPFYYKYFDSFSTPEGVTIKY